MLVDQTGSTIVVLLKEDINLENSYTISKEGFKDAIEVSYTGLLIQKNFMMHFIMMVMI